MSDEKRFPPPGNEVGYREAALPSEAVDAPAPAEASDKKRVVATLAEPPEVAQNQPAPGHRDHEVVDIAHDDAVGKIRQVVLVGLFVLGMVLLAAYSCRRSDRLIVDRAKVECISDVDCVNSCSQGAVNSKWLARHSGPKNCEDGCAGPLALPPRCIHLECVAFEADPDGGPAHWNDRCTKK